MACKTRAEDKDESPIRLCILMRARVASNGVNIHVFTAKPAMVADVPCVWEHFPQHARDAVSHVIETCEFDERRTCMCPRHPSPSLPRYLDAMLSAKIRKKCRDGHPKIVERVTHEDADFSPRSHGCDPRPEELERGISAWTHTLSAWTHTLSKRWF